MTSLCSDDRGRMRAGAGLAGRADGRPRRARPCRFRQVCGVFCPAACSKVVFACFGFSALRFMVAVITVLDFALAFVDTASDTRGRSAGEAEATASALRGASSAVFLDWIKTIAWAALNRGGPSRQP
jgi:hypothetical protein